MLGRSVHTQLSTPQRQYLSNTTNGKNFSVKELYLFLSCQCLCYRPDGTKQKLHPSFDCLLCRVTSHSKHFQLASNTQSQLSSAAHGLSKFCVLDQAIMTSNPTDLNINISQTNSKTDIGIFK